MKTIGKKKYKATAKKRPLGKKKFKATTRRRRRRQPLDPIWMRVVSDVIAAFLVEEKRAVILGATPAMHVTDEVKLAKAVKREAQKLCARLKTSGWVPCITPGCKCRWKMLTDALAKGIARHQRLPSKKVKRAAGIIVQRFLNETSAVN